MKLLRLALVAPAFALLALAARAQQSDDQQQQQQPPTVIPDFSNLDEYIYVPKSTVNFGYRYISGVKARFSGNGILGAPEAVPSTDPNVSRTYHDGTVNPDSRDVTDNNGNGTTTTEPLNGADGKTDNWSYSNQSQLTSDGYMAMNLYSVQTQDPTVHDQDGKGNVGMEVFVTHDMKRLARKWEWKMFMGLSLSDIQASTFATVPGTVSTLTDTYDLYGQTPPAAPYTSPSSNTINVVDASGNQETDSNGNDITETVGGSVLLSNSPLTRTVTNAVDDVDIQNNYKLHGGFMTLRLGPQLIYEPTEKLQFLFSAGPAIIESGSTYTVTEVFNAPTGAQEVGTLQNVTNRLLLGFYVDATMQYNLSDRSGLYLGVFDQSAGGYTQSVNTGVPAGDEPTTIDGVPFYSNSANPGYYSAHVDFSNEEGFRAGMAYKF